MTSPSASSGVSRIDNLHMVNALPASDNDETNGPSVRDIIQAVRNNIRAEVLMLDDPANTTWVDEKNGS